MPKFQVDLPEGFDNEGERPQFSFRDAEPVGVGEPGAPIDATPREKTLMSTISLLLQSHEQIQNADTQLFALANFITMLKTGEREIDANRGVGKEMVQAIRKLLLHAIVTLDQTLLVIDLEERGVLGEHDGREFARLGLGLIERIREEFERWDLPQDGIPDIPEDAVNLMKQAVADMEAEAQQEAANG